MQAANRVALYVLLAATGAHGATAQSSEPCAGTAENLKQMLQTEYAFAERAQSSVRDAFLEYLAEDSLVLEPGPTPGRAFYEAAKPSSAKLEWYPAVAAAGESLGFSSGPWIYTGVDGKHAYGHFVTIWKLDTQCRWRAEFDGGVSHEPSSQAEPKLPSDAGLPPPMQSPSKQSAADAIGAAVRGFERTAQEDGLAAGLRTYARDGDFMFYMEGAAPMSAGAALRVLSPHSRVGSWSESAQGRSADAALAYSVGEFAAKKGERHAYLQVWQYDPKVANWGLRIFLQSP